MFEYGQVSVSSLASQRSRRRPAAAKLAQAAEAAHRASRLQGERLSDHLVEVSPPLRALVPEGGLRAGSAYRVEGSTALLAAFLSAPSSAGLWCGIVGMPGFSATAAAAFGCDLERLALVPHPGRDWVNVAAALIDAMPVVVIRPPRAVSDAEAARLAARLRQREAVLLAVGAWPRADSGFGIGASDWHGVGAGHGHLTARRVTVTASGRAGRALRRRHGQAALDLWLPDSEGVTRLADTLAGAGALPARLPVVEAVG